MTRRPGEVEPRRRKKGRRDPWRAGWYDGPFSIGAYASGSSEIMGAHAAGFRRRRNGRRAVTVGPIRRVLSMIVLGLSLTQASPAWSQTGEPPSTRYLVIKDVNLRARPTTRSAKTGQLKKGQTVAALGLTKDGWAGMSRKARAATILSTSLTWFLSSTVH